jgi:hypothetical protein
MSPSELRSGDFKSYPPEARSIAASHTALLQKMPLALLGLLLRELIDYDWKFPAERLELDNQLSYLSKLSPEELQMAFTPFSKLRLSDKLTSFDWVNLPSQFSEQLTAHLWATHQIDAFRSAAIDYVHEVNARTPAALLPISRLTIVVMGSGIEHSDYPLFRKLRPHGTYFDQVQAVDGWATLRKTVEQRAAANPLPFAHWYIDGASAYSFKADAVTAISYDGLAPVRESLIDKMRQLMQPGQGGPEVLRTLLAAMRPEDVGLSGQGAAAVLNRFQLSILTEGSGTQLFSTTFVQWSAREALRRAQPLTLLARFAPRQREQSMKDLLAGVPHRAVSDPEGSLIDADMGTYYTWINQQRLPGAEQASFLVWFENHSQALAIAPALGRGQQDHAPLDLQGIIARL